MNQTADLLRNAAQALGTATSKMDEVLRWQAHTVEEVGALRERIAALEATERERDKWNGEERRKVDKKFETGHDTFALLRQQIANAESAADSAYNIAKDALDAIDAATGTRRHQSRWEWFKTALKEKAIEVLVQVAIGAAFWALYHFLLVGPEIAKALKAIRETGGHP